MASANTFVYDSNSVDKTISKLETLNSSFDSVQNVLQKLTSSSTGSKAKAELDTYNAKTSKTLRVITTSVKNYKNNVETTEKKASSGKITLKKVQTDVATTSSATRYVSPKQRERQQGAKRANESYSNLIANLYSAGNTGAAIAGAVDGALPFFELDSGATLSEAKKAKIKNTKETWTYTGGYIAGAVVSSLLFFPAVAAKIPKAAKVATVVLKRGKENKIFGSVASFLLKKINPVETVNAFKGRRGAEEAEEVIENTTFFRKIRAGLVEYVKSENFKKDMLERVSEFNKEFNDASNPMTRGAAIVSGALSFGISKLAGAAIKKSVGGSIGSKIGQIAYTAAKKTITKVAKSGLRKLNKVKRVASALAKTAAVAKVKHKTTAKTSGAHHKNTKATNAARKKIGSGLKKLKKGIKNKTGAVVKKGKRTISSIKKKVKSIKKSGNVTAKKAAKKKKAKKKGVARKSGSHKKNYKVNAKKTKAKPTKTKSVKKTTPKKTTKKVTPKKPTKAKKVTPRKGKTITRRTGTVGGRHRR